MQLRVTCNNESGFALAAATHPAHRPAQPRCWTKTPGVRDRVYANPATGEVLGWTSYFNVQRFFRSFHMSPFIDVWRTLR